MIDRRDMLRGAMVSSMACALPRLARAEPTASFASWLEAFRADAAAAGISTRTLDSALGGLKPIQRVLELDQKQPETTITFAQYISKVVNSVRIGNGRKHLAENRPLLDRVAAKYNVQPRFIVALWAVESDFGASTGGFSVVASLATLAWSSTRPELFRSELIAALKILDRYGMPSEMLKGSWAGAMGQCQFMPSSYLRYAVDYDNAGRPDIWSDRADVFASIANYLSHEGWDGAFTWGRDVKVPGSFDESLINGKVLKTIDAWAALGVRRGDGGNLPKAALQAGLVQPGGTAGPTLLTYNNFRVIMKWNRSTYFATSVSYLADRIEV
jgi:membrane-bound lytic murein transglycosylase B